MLGRRHDVASNIRRLIQIAKPERIGETERLPQLPHLQRCRSVYNLGASIVCDAAVKKALGAPRERIMHAAIGERELGTGIESVDGLGHRATRLTKPDVERHQPTTYVGKGAVKYDSAPLIAIEAKMNERTDEASAL